MTVYFGDDPMLNQGYPSTQPNNAQNIGAGAASFIGGILSMFGQRQQAYPGQPGYMPPQPGQPGYVEPTPLWVYLAIPVGVVGLLVVAKKSMRKRSRR